MAPTSQSGITTATGPGTKIVKRIVLNTGQKACLTAASTALARQPAQPYGKIENDGRALDAASTSSLDPRFAELSSGSKISNQFKSTMARGECADCSANI